MKMCLSLFLTLLISFSTFAGENAIKFDLSCDLTVHDNGVFKDASGLLQIDSKENLNESFFYQNENLVLKNYILPTAFDLYIPSFDSSNENGAMNFELIFFKMNSQDDEFLMNQILKFNVTKENSHCVFSQDALTTLFGGHKNLSKGIDTGFTMNCHIVRAFLNDQKCLVANNK